MNLVTRLIENAKRLGHGAHTVAMAAGLIGVDVQALCAWCYQHHDPMWRNEAERLGGECMSCAYSGPDVVATWQVEE